MRKLLIGLVTLLVCFGLSPQAWAGKFIVNGTNTGQITDLAVTNASTTTTTRSGVKGTIDLGSVTQADTTKTTTPVIALSQSATTAPVFSVTCTTGQTPGTTGTTCTCYTSTVSTKKGTIKVNVNGVDAYIDYKASPN